jgi:predicted AlkP superfamily pyrophosphatase or phosphodiesterase
MRSPLLILLSLLLFHVSFSQTGKGSKQSVTSVGMQENKKPRLVVGLVVDQMRWDFLYRFRSNYSSTGFNRLLREGFSCEQTLINYTPTYTAPGHAAIFTGSPPALSGIVGNGWFDRQSGKFRVAVTDTSESTVGSDTRAGRISPRQLLTTTLADEMRLATHFNSKTVGIAIKDRGAVLPAGHTANAAYWYDDESGNWVSSTYYMQSLPGWAAAFNAQKSPDRFMQQDWNLLLSPEAYSRCDRDMPGYEAIIEGLSESGFPHELSRISKKRLSAFKTTPFAATHTFDMARAAIQGEQLGGGAETDFLSISISSTDYIGHAFGPNSLEVQDAYLRLDRDLSAFLQYLDKRLGRGNYLFFLTADHGVSQIPEFLTEHHIPSGRFEDDSLRNRLNQSVREKTGLDGAVRMVTNYQVYLADLPDEKKEIVYRTIQEELTRFPFISHAFRLNELGASSLPEPVRSRMVNGYYPARSGDIGFLVNSGYVEGDRKGTSHGQWNPYDAHIPLVFFGTGISSGKTYRETAIIDIAPTVAALLQIQMPSGSVGKVIGELFR